MDLASVVAALASVGVRVSGSTPNNNIQGDSSRACPTGLAGPELSGTHNDPGQHFQRDIRQQHEKEHAERQKSAPSSTAQRFRVGDPVSVIRPRPMGTHRTKT